MPGNEHPDEWERRLEELRAERDRRREIAERNQKERRKKQEKKREERKMRRDLATQFRSHSRSLLAVGVLGLFVASVFLTLILLDVSNLYSSLIPQFAGAFAMVISLYVLLTRFRIGKMRSLQE
jgi:hypothetical protein